MAVSMVAVLSQCVDLNTDAASLMYSRCMNITLILH